MNAEAQVDSPVPRETRLRPRMMLVAAVAGALLLAASMIGLAGQHTSVSELTLDLLVANQRFPLDLISGVVNGLASLAITVTLLFLFSATRARNPSVRGFIRWVALIAGPLAALSGIVYAIVVAIKVHQFATTGLQTYQEANRLTGGGALISLQLLGQLSALLMALAFVLVSLQAMNVGLLNRFMGYLGMFAGALFLFQITQVPVVQAFWLLAIAYLLSGRWPSGVPPAWLSGRAEPWPSSAQVRAQRMAQAQTRGRGRSARGGSPTPAPSPAEESPPAGISARTRSTTPKRKRKHRG